jgi:hypothetical protein
MPPNPTLGLAKPDPRFIFRGLRNGEKILKNESYVRCENASKASSEAPEPHSRTGKARSSFSGYRITLFSILRQRINIHPVASGEKIKI